MSDGRDGNIVLGPFKIRLTSLSGKTGNRRENTKYCVKGHLIRHSVETLGRDETRGKTCRGNIGQERNKRRIFNTRR